MTRSPWSRPLTWIILAWNALMGVVILVGLVSAANDSASCSTQTYADACRSGAAIGTTVGVFLLLGLTAFGDVILGVIWLVTRRPALAPQPTYSIGQAGWFPDPYGRFWRRWWDGGRWTAYVSTGTGEEALDPLGAP